MSQQAVVRICELSDCAGTLLAEYTTVTGPGSETVRVVAEDEQYVVNWHTDEFAVSTGVTYRIGVFVEAQELGYADVQLTGSGGEARNITTNELIGLKDGRTLPIKFRIEEGAVGFRFVSIDAGEAQTCALGNESSAWCWGDHGFGQSGTGLPLGDHLTPQPVTGGYTFSSVRVADGEFSCGVTTSHDALCWGRNNEGQLGTVNATLSCAGGRICIPTPSAVYGSLQWDAVDPGGQSLNCGLDASGAAWCWGLNGYGLGDGVTSQSNTPVAVAGGLTFVTIATGGGHACGITSSGQMYCWGGSPFGEGGRGNTAASPVPAPVSGRLWLAGQPVCRTVERRSPRGGSPCGACIDVVVPCMEATAQQATRRLA